MNSGLLEHVQAFVAIAHNKSVTAASIATNIGQATLSRQLAALEKHLGCRLLNRSTRAISLTQDGAVYLRHAERMLQLNAEAEEALHESKGRLQGRLRVACSNAFARRVLIPLTPQWQTLHPNIHLELVISDRLAPLIEDRIDVAFRMAPLQPSSLVARAIGVFPRVLVASVDYVRSHRWIKEPKDLREHQCILYSGAEHPNRWRFTAPNGETLDQPVDGKLSLSTVDAVQGAVLESLGVAVTPAWFWTREQRRNQIQQLLPAYRLPEQTIHAVVTSRRANTPRTRRYVELVASSLERKEFMYSGEAW